MMNPFSAILKNAQPKMGSQNIYGLSPNVGSSTGFSIGGEGSLSEIMKSSVGMKIGWTNYTVKVAIYPRSPFTKSDSVDPEYITNETQRYHPIFVMKRFDPTNKKGNIEPLITALNLPSLNYILAKRTKQSDGKNQYDENDVDGYETISDILEQWSFFGFVSNEEGENNLISSRKSATKRKLNLVVKGKAVIHDVFGGDATIGTNCFFIVKKVRLQNNTSFLISHDKTKVIQFQSQEDDSDSESETESELGGLCFQVIPYANRHHVSPPQEALIGDDNIMGKAFYIGKIAEPVSSKGSKHNNNTHEKAISMEKIARSRTIEFNLDHEFF